MKCRFITHTITINYFLDSCSVGLPISLDYGWPDFVLVITVLLFSARIHTLYTAAAPVCCVRRLLETFTSFWIASPGLVASEVFRISEISVEHRPGSLNKSHSPQLVSRAPASKLWGDLRNEASPRDWGGGCNHAADRAAVASCCNFHGGFVCMSSSWQHVFTIWDPSTSLTRCKRNTKLSIVLHIHLWFLQRQLKFPLATPEQCVGWCIHTIFEVAPKELITGFMSGEHGGQDHPHLKHSLNLFDRTRLPNTSCRTSKTLAVCGRTPPCWNNVMSTCPAPWMTRMTSFYSCCRYRWLVMVPPPPHKDWSNKSLLVDCTPHGTLVGWSDVSTTLDSQRPRTLCCACSRTNRGGKGVHH
jgi:hypothetical protein